MNKNRFRRDNCNIIPVPADLHKGGLAHDWSFRSLRDDVDDRAVFRTHQGSVPQTNSLTLWKLADLVSGHYDGHTVGVAVLPNIFRCDNVAFAVLDVVIHSANVLNKESIHVLRA